MQWKHEGNTVAEVVFKGVSCLRFKGSVPFTFDTDAYMERGAYIFSRPGFQTYPPAIEYVLATLTGLTFVALKGKISAVNGDDQKTLHRRIQIESEETGSEWEFLL